MTRICGFDLTDEQYRWLTDHFHRDHRVIEARKQYQAGVKLLGRRASTQALWNIANTVYTSVRRELAEVASKDNVHFYDC